MLFGAAAETAKATHRHQQLKKLIENQSRVQQHSIIEFYTGLERFQYAQEFLEVLIESKPNERQDFLEILSTEFFKVKSIMSSEPINQAQIIALALAIKELALNFDKKTQEFDLKSKENELKINDHIYESKTLLENQLKNLSEKIENSSSIFEKKANQILDQNISIFSNTTKRSIDNLNQENQKNIELNIKHYQTKFNIILFLFSTLLLINISTLIFLFLRN